ncbi:MAG: hypothetical protein QM765_22935 [Myxococcales bacterium]
MIHAAATRPRILGEDPLDAGEAAARVLLLERRRCRHERALELTLLEQRERQEPVAGRVIRPLLHRLGEAVDGEVEPGVALQVLEPLAREAAQVGASGEQVDDGAVGPSGAIDVAGRLADLAQGDERHDVTQVLLPPTEGLVEGGLGVLLGEQVHHLLELPGVRIGALLGPALDEAFCIRRGDRKAPDERVARLFRRPGLRPSGGRGSRRGGRRGLGHGRRRRSAGPGRSRLGVHRHLLLLLQLHLLGLGTALRCLGSLLRRHVLVGAVRLNLVVTEVDCDLLARGSLRLGLVLQRGRVRLRRRYGLHAALGQRQPSARVDGEDVGEGATVDLEAGVVLLRLEDEERGVAAQHAVLHREVDDRLLQRGLLLLAVGLDVHLVLEAGDARLHPRALEQRAVDGGQLEDPGWRTGDGDLHRSRRRQVCVDQHLVSRLDAADLLGPPPGSALDLHLQVRARGLGELARQDGEALARIGDHAVLGQARGHQPAQQRVVADAPDRQRVEALHAGRLELERRGDQLVATDRARSRDAVADEDDALHAALAGALGRPEQGALQVGGAQRAALLHLLELGVAEGARRAVEDDLDGLVEARDGDRRLGARARGERLHEALDEPEFVLEPEGARGAGVDEDDGGGDLVGLGLGHRPDAREHEVGVAQARARGFRLGGNQEVGVGDEAGLLELGGLLALGEGSDVELAQLRQALERQDVRRGAGRQLLGVGDDELP